MMGGLSYSVHRGSHLFVPCLQVSADLKSLEEEKNRLVARLTDEVKAKEDLQGWSRADTSHWSKNLIQFQKTKKIY